MTEKTKHCFETHLCVWKGRWMLLMYSGKYWTLTWSFYQLSLLWFLKQKCLPSKYTIKRTYEINETYHYFYKGQIVDLSQYRDRNSLSHCASVSHFTVCEKKKNFPNLPNLFFLWSLWDVFYTSSCKSSDLSLYTCMVKQKLRIVVAKNKIPNLGFFGFHGLFEK